MRITWIGHSTVAVEVDGVALLTDPVLRSRVAHLRRVVPPAEPPAVDAVLVSHVHYDHLDLPSLRGLGRHRRLVVPKGAAGLLRLWGFRDVTELDVGGEVEIGGVTVRATPAEHSAWRPGVSRTTPSLGFVVLGSSTAYFAGDTDVFDGMGSLVPALDVALLPVAGWGPRVPAGHLDPEGAARALALLRPRVAVPIHWGTYRRLGLSTDPAALREPAEEFARLAAEAAPAVRVVVLEPGAGFDLSSAEGEAAGGPDRQTPR